MSDLDRRIAVEVMGWKVHKPHKKYYEGGQWHYKHPLAPYLHCHSEDDEYTLGGGYPSDFTPSTDLNHAKLAWDKLSDTEKWDVHEQFDMEYCHANDYISAVLDPHKLCNAILLAVGGDNDKT